MSEPVTLLFENGKTGEVDYRGQGGAVQPTEENIVVELCEQENISLWFLSVKDSVRATVKTNGKGTLGIRMGDKEYLYPISGEENCSADFNCEPGCKYIITLTCHEGIIQVDTLDLI